MPQMKTEGSYTRKRDGKVCTYTADYSTSDSDVIWNARVYVDGQFVGAPGGRLLRNLLEPKDLEYSIRSMVEGSIEGNVGLDT
ncbi:MAG TPA: hypothetical protein VGY49_09430 [Burkholderiaceae bacterium]|jgi:hypothetical protein|nr:hypothetical protein [Burkholderiaceae bacterium]